MDDKRIVELLFARKEQGITEVKGKYGKLVLHISRNILPDEEDVLECENDTYLGVWNAVPPERPNPLMAFVCKIARNLALKKHRHNTADKRDNRMSVALDELGQDIFSVEVAPSVEEEWSVRELGKAIQRFLGTLKKEDRMLFVRRYWFGEGVTELAAQKGMRKNTVSVRLNRIRGKLKEYLEKEGFSYE